MIDFLFIFGKMYGWVIQLKILSSMECSHKKIINVSSFEIKWHIQPCFFPFDILDGEPRSGKGMPSLFFYPCDRRFWFLICSDVFSMWSTRSFINNKVACWCNQSRWIKLLHIKFNVLCCRLFFNNIPNRNNLVCIGLNIPSTHCLVCDLHVESINHLFFLC